MAVHQLYRTQGFVFKKTDRQEADRVFSVFTQDFGRVEITARGVRKISSKLRGGIEICSVSDIEFVQGKYRKTLVDALAQERFLSIMQDPTKIAIAYNICNALHDFIKGQQVDKNIWQLVVSFFEKLQDEPLSKNSEQLFYDYFFWNFMKVLGYGPELFVCAMCRDKLDPKNLYFSCGHGGVLCARCQPKDNKSQKISADAVKLMRLFLTPKPPSLSLLKTDTHCRAMARKITGDYNAYILSSFKHHE